MLWKFACVTTALLALGNCVNAYVAGERPESSAVQNMLLFEGNLGKRSFVTLPSSGSIKYPDGIRTVFRPSVGNITNTDHMFIDGVFNNRTQYAAEVPDAATLPLNGTLITPVYARFHFLESEGNLNITPLLDTVTVSPTRDEDCDDGKECFDVSARVVDVDNLRCVNDKEFERKMPCWLYVDSVDCSAYNTTNTDPQCFDTVEYSMHIYLVTIKYDFEGDTFTNNYPTSAVGTWNATTEVFQVSYNATEPTEYFFPVNSTNRIVQYVVQILVTSTKAAYTGKTPTVYLLSNLLYVAVDPDTAKLSVVNATMRYASMVSWDLPPTYVINSTTGEFTRRSVTAATVINDALPLATDGYGRFTTFSPYPSPMLNNPTFPTLPAQSACESLLGGILPTGENIPGTVQIVGYETSGKYESVFTFFETVGSASPQLCYDSILIGGLNAAVSIVHTVEISPPEVDMCVDDVETLLITSDLDGTNVVSSIYTDESSQYAFFGKDGNLTSVVHALLQVHVKDVAWITGSDCTSRESTNSIVRCALDQQGIHPLMFDVVDAVVAGKYNDTAFAECVNRTEYNIVHNDMGCETPNITISCDICGLSTFDWKDSFEYKMPSCNFEPCELSTMFFWEINTLNRPAMCEKWLAQDGMGADTSITASINMTLYSGDTGKPMTRNYLVPINATWVTVDCDGLGYVFPMMRRGVADIVQDTVSKTIGDAVDTAEDALDDLADGLTEWWNKWAPFKREVFARAKAGGFGIMVNHFFNINGVIVSGLPLPLVDALLSEPDTALWPDIIISFAPNITTSELQNIIDNLQAARAPSDPGALDGPVRHVDAFIKTVVTTPLVVVGVSHVVMLLAGMFSQMSSTVVRSASMTTLSETMNLMSSPAPYAL